MNNTSVLVPMLMVYLLFSKVSYSKLQQPSVSFFNQYSGSFIHFSCVSPFWLQHDKGTLYCPFSVGKMVSYFGLVQSAYPSTPQQLILKCMKLKGVDLIQILGSKDSFKPTRRHHYLHDIHYLLLDIVPRFRNFFISCSFNTIFTQ